MVGRMAYNYPWEIARIDKEIFGVEDPSPLNREEILHEYSEFA